VTFSVASLDRRGAEPDERSESDEVGWWNKIKEIHHPGLCLVTFGASPESTPSRQSRFARCRDETPVWRGVLGWFSGKKLFKVFGLKLI
jgi:hypothetical protein